MSLSKEVLDFGVIFVNFLLMMMVGMELQPRHFSDLAQRRRFVLVLFAAQVAVLPVLGFLVAWLLALPSPIAAGILLLAACPVGDIANLYTLLGRGNLALSVLMNTVTCLLSMLTMALVFPVYEYLLGGRFLFAIPTPTLVGRLLLMVVLPILAGTLLRRVAPDWSARRAVVFKNASMVGVAFLVVYVLVTQQRILAAEWRLTAIAGGTFMGLAMLAGATIGRVFQLPAADRLTCSILFSVRHVGLAMAIAVTLLHRLEYALFAVVYFLTEVPLLLAFVAAARYRQDACSRSVSRPDQPAVILHDKL